MYQVEKITGKGQNPASRFQRAPESRAESIFEGDEEIKLLEQAESLKIRYHSRHPYWAPGNFRSSKLDLA